MASASTSRAALSGFWSQFFRDIDDIDALFQGAEELGNQFYSDALTAVLTRSLRDASLFRRETARSLMVRASQITRDPTNSTRRHIALPTGWRRVRYIQDALLSPSTILDGPADFELTDTHIVLKNDLRSSLVASARKAVPVSVGGILTTDDATLVVAGDVVLIDGVSYVVKYANSHDIGLSETYKFPKTDKVVSWRAAGGTVNLTGRFVAGPDTQGSEEIYDLWAVDLEIDDYALYNNFGYVLAGSGYEPPTPTPSSEAYRNFLTGVYKLRTGGPTPSNLKAAATAVAGLPLAMFPNERVVTIDTDATSRRVITDRRLYVLPLAVPLASDVQVGAVLPQYAPLANVVEVLDHTTYPYWWYGRTVPAKFLPTFNEQVRVATDNLIPNQVADNLNVVGQATSVDDPYANRAAYLAMGVLLKYQSFGVKIHPTIAAAEDRIRRLVLEARPADKYPYVWVA